MLDEDWNAVLLAGHPAITAADLATSSPALSALRRAVAETVQRIVDGLGAAESPLTLVPRPTVRRGWSAGAATCWSTCGGSPSPASGCSRSPRSRSRGRSV